MHRERERERERERDKPPHYAKETSCMVKFSRRVQVQIKTQWIDVLTRFYQIALITAHTKYFLTLHKKFGQNDRGGWLNITNGSGIFHLHLWMLITS